MTPSAAARCLASSATLLIGAVVTGCGETAGFNGIDQVAVVQAPDSIGVPGWRLRDTLVVRVTGRDGGALSGVAVLWTVRQGGGSVRPLSDSTDAAGYAAALWTLGQPGINRLRASTLGGDSAAFAVTAAAFRADQFDSAYKLGCGLVSGAIWCWGSSVGFDDSPSIGPTVGFITGDYGWSAQLIDDSRQYVAIAVDDNETFCALDAAGSVWCGTLPHVSGEPPVFTITQQVGVPPLFAIRSLEALTGYHFCGLASADSLAWCFTIGGAAAAVAGSPALASIVAGNGWYCGIRADSLAVCWGTGPLGDGTTQSSATPVEVAGGHHFIELGADWRFACGLSAERKVYCWSGGGAPAEVAAGVSDLSVGNGLVMVLQAGTARMGLGPQFDTGAIPALTGLEDLPVVSLSPDEPSCVRLVSGEMYCWDELWINSSDFLYYNFSPVQPPVPQ